MDTIPPDEQVILMDDFNAMVGDDWKEWKDIIGKHGVKITEKTKKNNDNRKRLLNFCDQKKLSH